MKCVISVVAMILVLAGVTFAQRAHPEPSATSLSPKMEEVPTPSGLPEPQAAPELLPESHQLPAEPPDLRLPSPSILKPGVPDSSQNSPIKKQLSPEEEEKNRARMAAVRLIAMGNPRVLDLLKEANGALSDEARREFMRAYYHTLCTRMRNLDSSLDETISAFEHAEIRKLAMGPSHIAIVSRDSVHKERQRHTRRSE
jgi:hypothetical protein